MQAITANNALAHTAICDLIRFYFRNGPTHYSFSGACHCVRVNVRASISVILAIGTKTMWKRLHMLMTERAQAKRSPATVRAWTSNNRKYWMHHATKANYKLWPGIKYVQFIYYLFMNLRRACSLVLFILYFFHSSYAYAGDEWAWWMGSNVWRGARPQMRIVCAKCEWIQIKYLNRNQMWYIYAFVQHELIFHGEESEAMDVGGRSINSSTSLSNTKELTSANIHIDT